MPAREDGLISIRILHVLFIDGITLCVRNFELRVVNDYFLSQLLKIGVHTFLFYLRILGGRGVILTSEGALLQDRRVLERVRLIIVFGDLRFAGKSIGTELLHTHDTAHTAIGRRGLDLLNGAHD